MVIGLGRYAQNGRIGAFLAVNNGTVEGCVSDVTFPKKLKSADFVYENNAKIANSISVRGMRKKQTRTFYALNTGSITTSGNVATPLARRLGSGNPEQIRKKLGIPEAPIGSGVTSGGFFANLMGGKQAYSGQPIPIGTADDLKSLIFRVNSGDKAAAGARYVLTNNINMKGARLEPIGMSENHPFMGFFDGNGKTVANFTVDCRGAGYGGFFGCTKNAKVTGLTLDYILKGAGGGTVGGMAGYISGGNFTDCQVRISMSPGMCSGGFCGKNTGTLRNCYVGGRIAPPITPVAWVIPGTAVVLATLIVGGAILYQKLGGDPSYNPEIIDPNQVPVPKPNKQEDPPPAGSNRISMELNQEIRISATTMVGQMDYINPHRSTQDVVIRLCISDAELKRAGYDPVACKVRKQKEVDAEGYDPEKSYTVLYRSQRLQIGYKLSYCKLSALPNGETLKVGDYEMVMMIDAYDPKTNEKAIVNAQAMTTIHVVAD